MKRQTRLTLRFGLTLLTLSGCSGYSGIAYHGGQPDAVVERGLSQVRSLIDSTIKGPAKAKHAQEIVEAIVAEVRTSAQQSRKFHEQLYDLNAKCDAMPEDFLKILDQLNNSRMKAATNILGLRFKMMDMLAAEEWKALSEGLTQAHSRYRMVGSPREERRKAVSRSAIPAGDVV